MSPVAATLLVATVILLVNLPFGAWRVRLRKLSLRWFVAVHVPVLLAMGVRTLLGVPFRWGAVPVYVLAFVAGQWLGMRLGRRGATGADVTVGPVPAAG
jgi:hypothetical protein